mgnify:CR=1 FL=1
MLKKGKILVVDDNQGIREALKILLGGCFERVETLPSPVSLMRTVESLRPDVILLDMNFKTDINTGNEGLFWLSEIKARWPEQAVVLFTAYADIALAVEGMKRGAEDFIVKPWENAKLIETLTGIRDKKKAAPKVKAADEGPRMFWGESVVMQRLRSNVEKIAATDATVLITGENGTGKDVLAHEIHSLSGRSAGPMVCVDAGAITETLFESELFGHVKGAFTDAKSDHAGKFEQANGGTLFLDEIANIPQQSQAKLLRVLQSRSVTRVGDTKSIPVDIRLICATNADVPALVRDALEKAGRTDLIGFTPDCLIRPVKGEKYFGLKPEERQQPPKKKKDGRPPKPEGTVHRGRRADGQKGKMSPKKKAAFAKQRAKKADGGRKDGSKR